LFPLARIVPLMGKFPSMTYLLMKTPYQRIALFARRYRGFNRADVVQWGSKRYCRFPNGFAARTTRRE
jgi:hypothetical protein